MYGNGSPSGISGMGRISGNAVGGSQSYFNKNAGNGSSHGLPGLGSSSGKSGMNKPGGPSGGFGYKYNAGGIGGGGIGGNMGIGSTTNKSTNENQYSGVHNY